MDLGAAVTIDNPQFAEVVFRRAKEAGFTFGQINLEWHPITVATIREVAQAASKQNFRVVSVSSNANLLRLAEASLVSGGEMDLVTLAQNLPLFGDCKTMVMWSGTYARRWTEPNLLNLGEDAYFAMVFELHRVLSKLADHGVTLAIQPCYAHILHDVATTLRLADDFADGQVCIALDPAYMIAPTTYNRHPQAVPQIVAALAPLAHIVSISDLQIDDGKVSHPLPGLGTLNLVELVKALNANTKPDILRLIPAADASSVEQLSAAIKHVNAVGELAAA
jgi:sugar phosphate isomerase/epimerase